MTESNLPEEELSIVDGIDPAEAEELDPIAVGQPDSYPGAAEDNPDLWRNDPLLQDEPAATATEGDVMDDQALRDESAGELANDVPTLGEAAADVDFGDPADESEVDGSDDSANLGGSPLNEADENPLDQ
ncbi:hypothetical protein [Arthrobacter sp. H20]|uniref:hypothetical protein n=1 Tax=Arthrobacter sp. H20 TaxID=1267981 RepID=UPI0004794531|nr:hypothetical protein [Arthrobacter sp. H20]